MNKNNNDITIWDAVKEGWKGLDAHAWPGMIMFLGLIAIEAGINVIVSIPAFGLGISLGVGLLFGVFLGAWHIISERPFNSIKQQSIVEGIVNIIGGMSIVLVVINLFRASGEGDLFLSWSFFPSINTLRGWDYVAIIIIGAAFAIHLLGYLSWHKADDRRTAIQSYNRRIAQVTQAGKDAELASKRAEIQCMALTAALGKEAELRTQYGGTLPNDKLNRIISDATKEIYAAFEKTYNVDLDGDGKIGGKPQNNQQPVQQLRQIVVNAADTEQVVELPTKAAHQ